MTFGFVHLKWNKFETSYSIVKCLLIGYHLSYDNQSKNILNVFDLGWLEIVLKWIWENFVEKFECITILNSNFFYENKYMLYLLFASMIENVWSNCINGPYWALSWSPFVDNLSSNLNSSNERLLGGKFGFIRTFA